MNTLTKLSLVVLTVFLFSCKHEYTCDCTVYEFGEETDEVETVYIEDTRDNARLKCNNLSIYENDTAGNEIYSSRCELR